MGRVSQPWWAMWGRDGRGARCREMLDIRGQKRVNWGRAEGLVRSPSIPSGRAGEGEKQSGQPALFVSEGAGVGRRGGGGLGALKGWTRPR